MTEWRKYRKEKKVENIPFKLSRTYSRDWKGEPHFFETEIFSYVDAKNFIQKFNLKSSRDYFKFMKTEDSIINLPTVPNRKYKNKGWVNWKEFLGYDKERESYFGNKYVSYDEVQKIIKHHEISTKNEWDIYRKKNIEVLLPSHPERTYPKHWRGWDEFLIEKKSDSYISFEDARKIAQSMKFKNVKEFQDFSKTKDRPDKFPSNPYEVYRRTGEWKGWPDFLGKEKK